MGIVRWRLTKAGLSTVRFWLLKAKDPRVQHSPFCIQRGKEIHLHVQENMDTASVGWNKYQHNLCGDLKAHMVSFSLIPPTHYKCSIQMLIKVIVSTWEEVSRV